MLFRMAWPPTCLCGRTAPTVRELGRHVLAGECPAQAPDGADGATAGAFIRWAAGRKWGKPMDEETKAKLAQRNADPAVKAERRERRRRERLARKRLSMARGRGPSRPGPEGPRTPPALVRGNRETPLPLFDRRKA
jgi:hypothetical protein